MDRNTGRATARGYVEQLEDENRWLTSKVMEYEQHLKQAGIPFKPALPGTGIHEEGIARREGGSNVDSGMAGYLPYRMAQITSSDAYSSAPPSSIGTSLISFGKGTSLSCLGVEVDIEDYVSPSRNNEADYTDWTSFWTAVFNRSESVPEPSWPAAQEGFETYAKWYFQTLNPYTPALSKPDVYDWVGKIGRLHITSIVADSGIADIEALQRPQLGAHHGAKSADAHDAGKSQVPDLAAIGECARWSAARRVVRTLPLLSRVRV